MFRSRFLWKLYAGYAAVILLTAGIVGALVAASVAREARAQVDQQLEVTTLLLREIWRSDRSGPALQRRVQQEGAQLGFRLTVIDTAGVVLADSTEDHARLDNHGTRPEVVAAAQEGRGRATRFSRSTGQHMRYLALPVVAESGALRGFVRASVPLASTRNRLALLQRPVAAGAAIATVVALAFAFLLARRTTRPLRVMTEATRSLAAVSDEPLLAIGTRNDELGALARAFDHMGRRLRHQLADGALERRKLAATLGSMVEGVVAVDGNERIVHMNEAAGRLLEVEPDASLGRPIWEVTRIREISEVLHEAMHQQEPSQRGVLRPGRTDQFMELRAVPFHRTDDTGAGAGLGNGAAEQGAVLVLEDVTQLRRLETVRQDFVANVSHELKTPVTAIRGLVETMLDDPEMPEETARSFLGKVRNQTLRLSQLVTDLLSLSRLDAEQGRSQVEPIDLGLSVRETVRALQPAIEAREIDIDVTMPTAPVHVLGDSEALGEAVGNLLSNAVKYSPAGGTVGIHLETDEPGWVTVAVKDHGPGIEPQHLGRIFERFFRVDRARSRALGGTGLGLAIVKHIARDLGGTATVDSEPGRGSTFYLRLPRHNQ